MGSLLRAGVAGVVAAGVLLAAGAPARAATPAFRHVLVVMLENRSYANVVGSGSAPYVNGTVMSRYATGTQLFVTTHNSPSAYFMLAAGKRFEKGDGGSWAGSCGTASATCSTADDSVFSQLGAAGRPWRVYSEDQTTPCQLAVAKKYWPNHNPALFFRRLGPNGYSATGDGSCRTSDLPFASLAADVAAGTVPDLAFLIPSDCDNMHDSCAPYGNPVRQGDAWLQRVFSGDAVAAGGLAAWAQANDALVLITFDESLPADTQTCCPIRASGGGGHVGLWVIGPPAKVRQNGFRWTEPANLFWLFRGIEQNFGFPLLGHAADAGVGDLAPLLIDQPAVAPAPAATLRLSAARVRAGDRVGVAGDGWPAGGTVGLYLDCAAAPCSGQPLATLTASATGAIAGSAPLGRSVVAGAHRLAAAAPATFASAALAVAPPVASAPPPAPRLLHVVVRGTLRVGRVLRCDAPALHATSLRVRWLRDGRIVGGRPARRVAPADRGRALACTATAVGPGGLAAARSPARRLSAPRCVVPPLAGLRVARAERRLGAAGCAAVLLRGPASGRVRRTAPVAGSAIRDGRPVALVARAA